MRPLIKRISLARKYITTAMQNAGVIVDEIEDLTSREIAVQSISESGVDSALDEMTKAEVYLAKADECVRRAKSALKQNDLAEGVTENAVKHLRARRKTAAMKSSMRGHKIGYTIY